MNDKIKYSIISGLLFLLITVISLVGTGHSGNFFRYIIPALSGIATGFILGWMKDKWILERNRLEKEIENQKGKRRTFISQGESLAAVLENIAEGVISIDDKGTVVLINKIAGQLTGWTPQEAVGKPVEKIFKIINEEMGKSFENPVTRALYEKQIISSSSNVTLVAGNGSMEKVAYHVSPLFEKERDALGAVLVFTTIGGEEKGKMKPRYVKSVETLGTLTRVIAHDFNNVLTVILGKVNLAQTFVNKDTKTYTLLKSAEDASFQATDLAQQLLDLTSDCKSDNRGTATSEIVVG